ncbi:MAG: PQQ-dependent sugar dehydrogenase [Pseudomonadota bacterium]
MKHIWRVSLVLAAALGVFIVSRTTAQQDLPFAVEPIAGFREPWSMAFMPDGRILVTEKKGHLFIVSPSGEKSEPAVGVPEVDYGGQGGLGDVVLHPDFSANRTIYLSYAESGKGRRRGAAVAKAVLGGSATQPELADLEVIWRQFPKVNGRGHYGHRMAFDDDGYLFISSGERQKFTPSQDMKSSMGKIIRLNDDGSVPADNPFFDRPTSGDSVVHQQVWSLGHRNPLGMAFDGNGRLWEVEMGPAGGDELNLIQRGANYGYPEVSNGNHYDGRPIPDHDTRPEFAKPAIWWTPVVSPGDLMIYGGDLFEPWRGNALVAGLSSNAIVRIRLEADGAKEVERYAMGARIRSLEEGPDGAVWVLEDGSGPRGRLLKLTPTGR